MNNSEVLGESLSKAHNVRFRINCEFLHSCAFHCPGCFVYRRNNFDEAQLDVLVKAVDMFRENGMTFDEIILGPTDFFAALNTAELVAEPKFKDIFKDGDVVLTLLSTLQSDEEHIREVIKAVNENLTHPNQEIEALIVFDLQRVMEESDDYVKELQSKLALLDEFNPAVDYALQMNIQDTNKLEGEFTLANITRFVRENFDTIVEFNPSFLRTRKLKLIGPILEAWNTMLEEQIDETNKNDITFTMANAYHAGFNEITFNFHNGDLYMCPFIYENVFDRSEPFKIPKRNGMFYEWADIEQYDAFAKIQQFNYATKTTECGDCPYLMSCTAKHVLFYMEQHDLKDCMISKPVVGLYE